MYFHASSEKLFLSEIPVECRISVIKSEPVKTPEHVVSQIYTGRLWNVRSRDFVNKVAENAMRSGYTHFGVKNNTPLKSFHTFHFEFWELSPKTFLEKNPGSELISLKDGTGTIEKKAEGVQYSVFVCPTVMKSEKFAKWLDIEFPEWYKRSGKPDVLCWDFEYNMYSSCLSCICKRCLKIFAEKNNIKEALTKEIIVAKYKKQWIDHLTSNLADVCKQLKTALVKFAPEAKIYIYSGYQSETTREIYGVDWKKLQPYIDLGGGGYGRPVKEIAATMNAMGNKPFLIGIIAEPYEVTSRIPPKPVSEAEIMRSYCDSRGGILTYMYSSLDGITLRANAKVSRIIAENEEFFIPDKYMKVSGKVKTSGGEAFVRSDPEGNLLVVFVNNGASPVKCKAVFPGKGKVIDCISGKTVSAAEKSVPSGGIAVFRQNR
jgi:hypothetical protein